MPIARHNFECPECACDLLEEVSRSMTYSMIDSFYTQENTDHWWPEWFDTEHEELEVVRYQCRDCGLTIHNGYCDNIYAMLKKKGYIVQDRPDEEESDWEV